MSSESLSQRIMRGAGVPEDDPWLAGCGCWTCTSQRVSEAGSFAMPMCLCPNCGNKRCPKATSHENACTGSNEPGQSGSKYGTRLEVRHPMSTEQERQRWREVAA